MFSLSLPPVVCRRAHVLITLLVFVCVWWCPTHTVLCFCFVFLRLVYPMLPVSLDCTFLIATSVFSNIYLFLQHCGKHTDVVFCSTYKQQQQNIDFNILFMKILWRQVYIKASPVNPATFLCLSQART